MKSGGIARSKNRKSQIANGVMPCLMPFVITFTKNMMEVSNCDQRAKKTVRRSHPTVRSIAKRFGAKPHFSSQNYRSSSNVRLKFTLPVTKAETRPVGRVPFSRSNQNHDEKPLEITVVMC